MRAVYRAARPCARRHYHRCTHHCRRSASGNRGTCSAARHSVFSHSRCFRTKDIASARRAGCGHKLPELPELPGLRDRRADLSRPRESVSTAQSLMRPLERMSRLASGSITSFFGKHFRLRLCNYVTLFVLITSLYLVPFTGLR